MKNILLVMSSQGILVPPTPENKEHEALWNETWKRLDRFLPHLFAEIFPEEAKKPRSAAPKKSSDSQVPVRTGTPSSQAASVVKESEVEGKKEEEKVQGTETSS
jgi:brefeldin A-resistance guanine nucleotide exchange factor 1